jgi:hypothetical protein
VLPDDWGTPASGPISFDLPKQWRDLIGRYRGLGKSTAFDAALEIAATRATTALLERDYIDADYRAEFANFYAQTFRPIPDRCERLHFFDTDAREYLGFTVLRPIKARPLCRTILRPPQILEHVVSCMAAASATPYGYQLTARGFPFISQDYQYGVCAHAAIWMIALYHHLAFSRDRYFMSDIVSSSRSYPDRWRLTPSEGLSFRQIIAILHDLKLAPLTYRLEDLSADQAGAIAERYLNSRLPVLLLAREHAKVLVGRGIDDQTGDPFFVCHDDAAGPYQVIPNSELEGWEDLVVPLPGRIYISGEAAEEAGEFVIRKELEFRRELKRYRQAVADGKTRLKTYVVPAAYYKTALRERGLPTDVIRWHVNVSTSNWIWIVELQDLPAANRGRKCVIGEVAIDATSDKLWPNPLFANLPGTGLRWLTSERQLRQETSQSDLYDSGAALHP